MRPYSFRCGWFNSHRFDEVDECNRTTCSRCGIRKPIRYAQIQPAEDVGRVMNRPKTKGAKRWT